MSSQRLGTIELRQRFFVTIENTQAVHEIQTDLHLPPVIAQAGYVLERRLVMGRRLGMGPQAGRPAARLAPVGGGLSAPLGAGEMARHVFPLRRVGPGYQAVGDLSVNIAAGAGPERRGNDAPASSAAEHAKYLPPAEQ